MIPKTMKRQEEELRAEREEKEKEDEEEEEEKEEEGEVEENTAAEKNGDKVDDDDEDDGVRLKKSFVKKCVGGAEKKCVPGIIYLGHIPPRFRPKHLRNLLSVYGEIGRIFLQPEDGQVRKRKKRSGLRRCDFTEGWVEFVDKRVAKRVAASLHNTLMGTRKRQHFSSDLWSMKYLHRFQWTHLSERLAYEQTVMQQRLRTEVSQAKRETNFYLNNVERSAHLDNVKKKRTRDGQQVEEKTWDFTQRQTEDEIQIKKKNSISQRHLAKAHLLQQKSQSNISLLAKIFNTNKSE
ncbi:activator of basal transcription 1-like%2C partial [Xyrichtys novacula]|uniref:Activator of basal transcription 1 n=1 Tax=Xyrichtys novacula TaxID=13765 RepID=A0AAV1HIG1_XYRNO|nr:activator of basal transcription 1-like%2C partial [Xyrichtys novacula]